MYHVAPIALFAFNRPEHLRRTLDALKVNSLSEQSSLTIFCDGPRGEQDEPLTQSVRELAKQAKGFASLEVIERPQNLGCAASVIDGLLYMFDRHQRLIVIEDDILCSPHTLAFLNAGLERYQHVKKVWNISAWSPPPTLFSIPKEYPHSVYAIPRFNCWGWASWRDRFQSVDWAVVDYERFRYDAASRKAFNLGGEDMSAMLDDQMAGRIDAWDIRVDYSRFKQNCVGINPIRSYTTNIGMGSGTHTKSYTTKFDNDITIAFPVSKISWIDDIAVNKKILNNYVKIYKIHFFDKVIYGLSRLGLLPFVKKIKNLLVHC